MAEKIGFKMRTTAQLLLLIVVNVVWKTADATESLQEPRFVQQPSGVSNILIENRTKILQCQARGYPQPKYRWFKDGMALSTELTSENFWRIQSPKRKDAGVYYCVATNDVGSVFSERVTFSVAYMGIFDDQTEKIITVEYGGAAVLELPAIESHPAPDVTWSTPDGPIPYDIKYAVTQKKLLILNANGNDEGSYRARAMNTQIGKEEYSPFFKLKVEGDPNVETPPSIVIAPKDAKIIKDQAVSYLDCIANARSLHDLRTIWTKDGIAIENARISFSFNDLWNRTLELISANLTYTGVYTCSVYLRSGGYPVINASAQVDVFEKPTFNNELKRETHGEYGSTVIIPCDAVGVPMPNIQWFHNAESIDPLIGTRFLVEEDGSLVIKKLTMDYAGMFQCLASNDAGEASSYTWLKVKTSTPILEIGPRNMTVLDGKDAMITCRAVGAPIPNTTWLLNDTIPVEIAGRVQLLETGDLSIAAVTLNDAGKYTCIRSNDAGSVNGSGYLSVHVRTQIIRPPSDTSVLLGHTAELQCKISNDPSVPYDIDWFHNSQLINTRASPRVKMREDSALEIIAVRASDVGEYTCSVISPGGNETRSARLSVIELPFAPINVVATRIEKISPRAINVTWVPGFDGNSPTKKFVIERRVVPEMGPIADTLSNWMLENDNVSASVRWCLLEDLKAAAAYQFRVTAVNLVGEGPPSEPSNIVALPQEPPSGPPVGFVGSARSDSEIITQWQPPLEEHRNGHILGYILRYRLHGYYNKSPWIIHNITNEAQKNYLLSDLITWKDYIVQIAAYNDKGVGIFTEGLVIKTKEGVPEAPPTNIRLESMNSTAIKVWWKPPNPQKINGINQGYKIQAWTGGNFTEANEFKFLKVPPSLFDPLAEQSAVIGGLRKYTLYNITVLCFTDPGDGERSQPIEIRTAEDVPGEVDCLQFDDISDRALTVKWTPPSEINGILTGYQLKYQIKDNPDSQRVLNFSSDVLSSEVTHLQPTTHYRFEVIAWTAKGSGKARVATIQSGVEPVLPEPPSKLALSNIDAFSVVLQFTPGFDGNSSITMWTVEAQTRRNTTWYKIFEVSDPDASTVTVEGLIPFMEYKLRLIANNVVGASKPSEPTKEFQTIQAPPSHPPRNVTVRAMSATELRVRWIPLQQIEWYGNPRGYNVTYTEVRTKRSKSIAIDDHTANSYVLEGMAEFALYEIVMQAYNDVGSSPSSPRAVERTREAVPSLGPSNVEANATSSTTILVKWGEVPVEHQNGQIEGYKVYYGASGSPFQYKNIAKNTTFTTTLTELRKFVQYHIQVLAYTRLGDGALSTPPIRVQTFEDVPGPPSNVSFPDVSFNTARIIWDTPEDPNGEILAYRVMFHLNSSQERQFSKEFQASDRTFQAGNLESEKYYMFSVTAQTRLGWGKTAFAVVLTTNNRERPQPPSMPQVSRSQVQSRQITFSWTPGPDGFAPLRYYTVQKSENSGPFQTIPERGDPTLTSYTATNLKPFTYYQFRIQATNDIGPSDWSTESVQAQTLPAAPSRGVTGLKVVPITTTSIEVHWDMIDEVHWSGDHETGGYRVIYQPVSDFPTALEATPKQEILGIKQTKMILSDLMEDRNYEIVVLPFNSEGDGPASPPVTVYVGEAVPTGEPQSVKAKPISSTEVTLQWKAPLASMQNGDLLGYKIFYLVTNSPQPLDKKQEEEIEVVPASYFTHNLVFLDKYTEYRIQVLAFNPAGDGPRSPPITVRTKEDLPGPPSNLQFSEITMTSLKVTWEPPKMRNGEIVGYVVTYETTEQNDEFSTQVQQKLTETSLLVQPLEEEVMYTFMVRALTIDFGPPVLGNVTTGPQEGSPMAPTALSVTKTPVSSVDVQWKNGASGKGPILGYYIETRRKDDTRWQTIVKTTNGPLSDYSVSYQNLLPSTSYLFRVISYNRFGISYPAYSSETIVTPSKLYFEYAYLQHKPFYRQTWFMVTLAATSIVIIIMVVAVLCVKSKSYKYKQEAQKTLEESMAMDIDDRQASDLSLYRTRPAGGSLTIGNGCGTLGKRSTLGRKSMHPPPPPMHGKSPPRPSPASVAYHSDEESLKGYDENPDDSSVTEKPSEISSTDSQGSESENESVQSDPHSFVNHYANVNDSLRQSWKRQKPVRNYSSYTDSEPEGSAVVSLNGGQIVMNNMARSRAPLPGFSSFV